MRCPRPESTGAPTRPYIRVVGAVIATDDAILAARRSAQMSLPGKWEFPGGKIEPGEGPRDAVRRELDEELDCQVEVGHHLITTVYDYDFGTVELRTYHCTLISGVPRAREHAELRWVKHNELAALDWAAADIPAVKSILHSYGAAITSA